MNAVLDTALVNGRIIVSGVHRGGMDVPVRMVTPGAFNQFGGHRIVGHLATADNDFHWELRLGVNNQMNFGLTSK